MAASRAPSASLLLLLVVLAHELPAASSAWLRGGSAVADAAGEERLIGWKGESHKSTSGGGGALGAHASAATKADAYGPADQKRGMWVETLSWSPRAFAIHNLLSPAECDEIVAIAKPQMRRSTVVDSVTGNSKVDPIRTSEQTFLVRGRHAIVTEAEARLERITHLPWYNGEDMQVLKYANGQKYDPHHDVGELNTKSGQKLAREGGYRVATVLLYLSDVEEGGETAFPDSTWADPALAERGTPWSECAEDTVAMHPKKGDALLFWSITPFGEIDPNSMHTGCPVIKGVKYTGTKWIHAGPFRYTLPPPPTPPDGCHDSHNMCRVWARAGECKKNPGYMVQNGKGACVASCKMCHLVAEES